MSGRVILPILVTFVCGFIIPSVNPDFFPIASLYGQEKPDVKKEKDGKDVSDLKIRKGEGLDEEVKKNKKIKITIE